MKALYMNNQMQCPWANWEPPSLVFCEESLCEWVRTPGNAWSNVSFLVVGLIIYWREKESSNSSLRGYGLATMLIGCLSFIYHASLTRYGEIGDLASMFLISVFLCRENLTRIGWLKAQHGRLFSWGGNILSTGLLFWIKDLGAPLFFIQCMVALALEIQLRRKNLGAKNYKYFLRGFYFWLSAQTIWFLDLKRIVCFPDLHWAQGHAVWHILMSGLAWCIYRHYSELHREKTHSST